MLGRTPGRVRLASRVPRRCRSRLPATVVGTILTVFLAASASAVGAYNCYFANSSCGTAYVGPNTNKNSGKYTGYGEFMNTPNGYPVLAQKWIWASWTLNPNDVAYGVYSTSSERVFTGYHTEAFTSHWRKNSNYYSLQRANCGWFRN